MHRQPVAWWGCTLTCVLACAFPALALPLAAPTPGAWQAIAPYGGPALRGAEAFAVGEAAYVVAGTDGAGTLRSQFWKYDPATNTWTSKADFPGTPTEDGTGFSIGSTGYVCFGSGASGLVRECWRYDPAADAWMRVATFPGVARTGCVAVTLGDKAYVFGGSTQAGYADDLWEYDPALDAWTRMADCPGLGRFLPAAFAIGGHIYIATGRTGNADDAYACDVWEYDPLSNVWIRRADFPGTARGYALGLSVGGKGYLAFGQLPGSALTLSAEVWEYDASSDVWTRKADFLGGARAMAVGFVLGSDLYFGLGMDLTNHNRRDFWRMRPIATAP